MKSSRKARPFRRALFSAALVIAAVFLGSSQARAGAELDRSYALGTVAALRESDNVDGLFADYVSKAYQDYFSRQSRFVYQELGRSDTVLERSKLPYQKVIEDNDILGQLARTVHAESLIRTRILKEGPEYQFKLEWLHSPKMEVMATETFSLQERASEGEGGARQVPLSEIHDELARALDRMIRKVPFVGEVTGRDAESLTVNLGAISGLHKGDELVIGTLEEVKKHPLLHAIVDWRLAETGHAIVENVDERIGFAKVTSEDEGHRIARYQKIMRVIPAASERPPTARVETESPGEPPTSEDRPKLGWLAAGPTLGGFSRQFADANGTGNSGGGFALGMLAQGQVWFNRQFFAELGFGYSFWNYTEQATTNGVTSGADTESASSSLTSFNADLGYTLLLTPDFYGPKGWIKAGYRSSSYTFPVSTTGETGPLSVKDLFLGLGGDLPVRGRWGALLNFEFGLFPGASLTGFAPGSTSGAHDIDFSLGAYYRYTNRLSFRCSLEVLAQGVDFTDGSSISQKAISLVPMAVYSF